jgi:hypothetical protein
MAKKAKKKAAKRRRKPKAAAVQEPAAPVARRITLNGIMDDLLELKAQLAHLL